MMPVPDRDRIGEDELRRYIDDVRMIKRTLDVAEGSFHLFDWFYYVMAGLVAAGVGVNILLAHTRHITMHNAFMLIWIPVCVLLGAAEMLAWALKSSRDKLPIMTPAFTKYLVAGSGMLIGLFTMAVFLIRPGFPVPGIVLLLVGTVMCVTVQYVRIWFLLEALTMVVIGLLFILIDARGEAYFIVDGVLIVGLLVLAGVIERILYGRSHRG